MSAINISLNPTSIIFCAEEIQQLFTNLFDLIPFFYLKPDVRFIATDQYGNVCPFPANSVLTCSLKNPSTGPKPFFLLFFLFIFSPLLSFFLLLSVFSFFFFFLVNFYFIFV